MNALDLGFLKAGKKLETKSIGISDLSAGGDVANESFEIDVKRNGCRYEVKLPWKEDCLPSSNSYHLCESRLRLGREINDAWFFVSFEDFPVMNERG